MSARHNRTAVLTPVASASQRQIEYKISKNLPANKELFTLIATPHPMEMHKHNSVMTGTPYSKTLKAHNNTKTHSTNLADTCPLS